MNNFLSDKQIKDLKAINWDVKPKGFRLTLYAEDHQTDVWADMCEIVGVPSSVSEFTTLSIGVTC